MNLRELKPRSALNKAFLKVKPSRIDIDNFKANLIALLDKINDKESEEFHKILIVDFLKKTYFKDNHFVNTKGRNDLVIHNGSDANSTVGVILEAKKPLNQSEMLSRENINKKALHELVLYYMRERILHKNLEIKHLIATNINEWFTFDAGIFERLFAQNKNFLAQFNNFESGRLADSKTEFFYKEIAEPFIAAVEEEIPFTYFNFQDYQSILRANDPEADLALIALFKLLSPEHLLKLPFANDSNSLDKGFYGELLYILGLTEVKENGKKLIQRNKTGERHAGTMLEDAINQLDSLDKIGRINNPKQYGNDKNERLFNVALELSITWINRILFLKLLEAQLIGYHKGDKNFAFLTLEKNKNYNALNSLFFQVLARKHEDRNDELKDYFAHVPYLNSSLFEPTELEHNTIGINSLDHDKTIPVYAQTVLKDEQGKKRTGKMPSLQYLFAFLDAYDFGAEGGEDISDENKTLISASVLGLIFEKINGYKDGSFFTPGFITMYMCRESIRKAVVKIFNEAKNWHCKSFEELKEDLKQSIRNDARGRNEVRKEANKMLNKIKICDPAVGSGHFLVSALNEIITIKSELSILCDKDFNPINDYNVFAENDELIITDLDEKLFEYHPNNKERQRIQETIFKEKQFIIENCLFGVDLNPNSVKICRLRLWIELLKNAYYKTYKVSENLIGLNELETLPNIDINIKCGNSLISRFAIDADLKQALKKSKWNIDTYKNAVSTYRNSDNKEQKREIERLISDIKSDFRSEISKNDPKLLRKYKLEGEFYNLMNVNSVFGETEKEKKDKAKAAEKLNDEIQKLTKEIEDIKLNIIYENAFEWRFEFPEVLNDEGDFTGFDVVIGNPPYIQLQAVKEVSEVLKQFEYLTYERTGDIYSLFFEKGNQILKNEGFLAFITSNKWLRAGYGKATRNYFLKHTQPLLLVDLGSGVFDEATVDSSILLFKKTPFQNAFSAMDISKEREIKNIAAFSERFMNILPPADESWLIADGLQLSIKEKIERIGKPLKDWDLTINYGIKTGFNEAFIIDGKKKDELIAEDANSAKIIKPILRGRDIKRYKAEFADLWLINTHNGLKSKKLPPVDVEKQYPAIYKHLKQYETQLIERTDKGDHWSNLRNCAYLQDFSKEKIVFQEMVQNSSFYYDGKGDYFCLDTGRIITGKSLKFLTAILNSKIFFYSVKKFYGGGGLGETGVRMKHTFFENFPLRDLNKTEQKPFVNLVNKILAKKEKNENTSDLEAQIDSLVYDLYELTEAEIKLVEKA